MYYRLNILDVIVWQMQMPVELSLPVQRVLRTVISGLMLVQCFTVYVYLASYIVLLYPVFLEERPTLVLPWLLLAAIRNLLCELTSLALGLGTCVLLGPARSPCIKFVILKLFSIIPAFYVWLLVFSYYHRLKVASTFKTFPAVSPSKDLDYGLELAVRRRRTKTLLGEDQVRKRLMDSLFCERKGSQQIVKIDETYKNSSNSSNEDIIHSGKEIYPLTLVSTKTISDIGRYEDWFGSEVVVPRDTDRILEQIVIMLLRIGVFLGKENTDAVKFLSSSSEAYLPRTRKVECISTEMGETPPLVASSKGRMASYLRDYPQIFMKKPSGLLCSLSSPLRLHDNITIVENIQSFHSLKTPEISLDSVSSVCENNDFLPTNEIESPSETLTYANEDVNNYMTGNTKETFHNPSFEQIKILDSVSSMFEDKKYLKTANEIKSSSITITDTKEDVDKDLTGKHTQNKIGQTSKETKSLNAKLSESIESVINRMEIRAACMDMPSSTSNNRNSTSPVNTESSENSNKNKANKSKANK